MNDKEDIGVCETKGERTTEGSPKQQRERRKKGQTCTE